MPRPSVRANLVLRRLRRGVAVFGPNLQIPSPELIEIIALAGFDFVMLDGEHGAAFSRLPDLLVACDAAGLTSIVRVPSHERSVLLPPLELGAGGLQVPFVNTAEQARAIVRECKFPPLGERGVSTVTRAARWGHVDGRTYRQISNRQTILILQLETREAVENADEIARVPGVDALFIGPADLAQSYGHRADKVTAPTIRVVARLMRRLAPIVPFGISASNRRDVARWHRLGARSFLTSSVFPLRNAFCGVRDELHSGLPAR